jgi:hypothetical protein
VPEYLLVGGPVGGSEYFKAARRGDLKGASSRVIKLQDINAEAFKSYVFWMHKNKLAANTNIEMDGVPHEQAAYPLMEKLVNLWLLGDRLADSEFRNTVMDVMIGVLDDLDIYLGDHYEHDKQAVVCDNANLKWDESHVKIYER